MSKDNFEGAVRSTLGQAEQFVGEVSQEQIHGLTGSL